ncbi:hypothetical protein F5887DRAFT_969977 [Amanita rubescens]|nr:hypothetical protein F5887DRAFT_969977 [Amanita rubescens]
MRYFTFAILFTTISIVFASPVYTGFRNALAISKRMEEGEPSSSQNQASNSHDMPALPKDLPKEKGDFKDLTKTLKDPNKILLVRDQKAQVFVVPLKKTWERLEKTSAPKLGQLFEIGVVIKDIRIPDNEGAQERWEQVFREIRVMKAMHGEMFKWVRFPDGRGVFITFTEAGKVFYTEEGMKKKRYGPAPYLRKVAIDARISSREALGSESKNHPMSDEKSCWVYLNDNPEGETYYRAAFI